MILRGVFFVFSLSIVLMGSSAVHAFTATTVGEIASGEFKNSWVLEELYGGQKWSFEGTLTLEHSLNRLDRLSPAWHVSYGGDSSVIGFWRGMPHLTEPSVFRILNKNQFRDETTVYAGRFSGLTCGGFSKMPLEEQTVQGRFAFLEKDLGPLRLLAMNLTYDTGSDWDLVDSCGRFTILQGGAAGRVYETELAMGWQEQGTQSLSRALVWKNDLYWPKGSIEAQYIVIEPGFKSLFASTNRFTPDRKGWEVRLKHEFSGVTVGLMRRLLENTAETRMYPRFVLDAHSEKLDCSVELRLQPTRALILKWNGPHSSWQADPIRQTLRVDWVQNKAANRITIDYPYGLVRVQTKLELFGDWLVVYKRDFRRDRVNFFARTRLETGRGFIQLDWGTYDRGNIRAAFDRDPAWRISWEYRF